MFPELSVIIVNYNGQRYLQACLDSLKIHLDGIVFEIILIDNNSMDNSCDYIEANYPGIILIRSNINYGFGKGNNEAVKKAKGKYLLLINNDTIVLDNLNPVLQFLKADPSIGAIGINMLNAEKKYLPVAGNFPNVKNMFQMKKLFDGRTEFQKGIFTESSYEVEWLSGSFLMVPKRVYEEVKGFDEDYFLYVEDVDFCKKIEQKGYKRIFLPAYGYIHFVGFNTSKNPLLVRGYEIYISKHLRGWNNRTVSAALAVNKLVKKLKQSLN